MTRKEVLQLHNGDEVTWNDPDGGICTAELVIYSIEVFSGENPMVRIMDSDGETLECFASELS